MTVKAANPVIPKFEDIPKHIYREVDRLQKQVEISGQDARAQNTIPFIEIYSALESLKLQLEKFIPKKRG